jgi:nicotinamidase-related amidase
MSSLQRRLIAILFAAAVSVAGSSGLRAQTVLEEWATVKPPAPPVTKGVSVVPGKTALLVMDFNRISCVPERRARCAAAPPNLHTLLTAARAKGILVVQTLSGTTTAADVSKELTPAPGERVIHASIDKFFGTDLEKTFKDKGIDTVIVTGTSANGAVLFTAAGAAMRGFKVVVPVDGMPADGAYQEQFVAWNLVNGPVLREHVTLTRIDAIAF